MVVVKLRFKRERFTPLTNSQWEVIEKTIDNGRKRKHSLRAVVNGILKITRTGTQWRNLKKVLVYIQVGRVCITTSASGNRTEYGRQC